MNKQIVVTDWIKEKPRLGSFLKLSLSSDERRILRGKRQTDCDQEIILQLPREGKLNDGDILSTNESNFYVVVIAKKENLIEISSKSKIELIKTAYHLGNRHVEVEIEEDTLLTKSDYVIENMLKNFKVNVKNIKKKPNLGPFLKLTLSSAERRILRGKRLTDCDQEIILQLPRKGKLNDGDILSCLLYTSPSPRYDR